MSPLLAMALAVATVIIAGLSLLNSTRALEISKRSERRKEANYLIYLKGSSEFWSYDASALTINVYANFTNLSESKDSIDLIELQLDFQTSSDILVPLKIQLKNVAEHGREGHWSPEFFDVKETRNLALAATIDQAQMPKNAVIVCHQIIVRTAGGKQFTQAIEPYDAQPIF